jgi:hypothetical protein
VRVIVDSECAGFEQLAQPYNATVDVTSELIRLQGPARRRARSWDVAFELVRASVGAPDSERYRLVTQRVIEEIERYVDEAAPDTDEEERRLIAALADPTAVLITTTLFATCLAEQVAGQSGTLVDEAISQGLARVTAMERT